MDATVEGSAASLRMMGRLADILGQIDALHPESGRQSLAELLAAAVDDTVQLGGGNARTQFIALARSCLEQPYGLTALAHCVAIVAPRTPALPDLVSLQDEFAALRVLPSADLDQLRALLRAVRVADTEAEELRVLRRLARRATDGKLDELPSHCRSAWTSFLHLVDHNAVSTGLPPAMLFLAAVAGRMANPAIAAELNSWNQRWAGRAGVAAELRRATIPELPANGDSPATAYLVFELDPDPFDMDKVVLSYWRQWDGRNGHAQRRGGTLVRLGDLETQIGEVVGALETDLGRGNGGGQNGSLFLEFVLPWDLLNMPVEFLRRDSTSIPLVVDHPVVIRSLERMRTDRYHRAWRQRWQALVDRAPNIHPYWSHAVTEGDDIERMALELQQDRSIVSVVLSEPPGAPGGRAWREASAAFQAGVPVIIWDRKDCSAPSFQNAVSRLVTHDGLSELPQAVARLRREALTSVDPHQSHPGQTLAVLWDDPDHLPANLLWDVKGALP